MGLPLNWRGVKDFRRSKFEQESGVLKRSVQPAINVASRDGHNRALILGIHGQLGIRFMHASHQWVVISVDREHGVTLDQFARGLVEPRIPKSCQAPRRPIATPKAPPYVVPRFPARFVKRLGRDDAALAAQPRLPSLPKG